MDWSDSGIEGCSRFLHRLWRLAGGEVEGKIVDREATPEDEELEASVERLILRVTDEFERWSYNTAVAAFMEFTNDLYRYVQSPDGARRATLDRAIDTMLLLLCPMTPHITAELWEQRRGGHIHAEPWPSADVAKAAVALVTMVVQVNGKVRDKIEVDAGIDEAEAEALALASENVARHLNDGDPKKVIVRVPKLVNVVV